MNCLRLRTGAWYGDRVHELEIPDGWRIAVFWPDTPPPVTDDQIMQALERPVGQAPIRHLAAGASRPLVIVDDLTRPTPAHRVLPFVLRQLAAAGIPARQVRLLVATGTHARPAAAAIAKKVGAEAAAACQVLVHDDRHNLLTAGRTPFGTPVIVNREVLASDFLIGIGGVYPHHSTAFSGGSKLALGVLGRRSIMHLHYGHRGVNGGYCVDNDFRRDLDHVARLIRLNTMVSLHVNADREAVRVVSGDHFVYYPEAAAFSGNAYRAPVRSEADVVISNAYPIDVSLTFSNSKGAAPLFQVRPEASRILISACSEGAGYHGLFPLFNRSRFDRELHLLRRLLALKPAAIPNKAMNLAAQLRAAMLHRAPDATRRFPMWLYPPDHEPGDLPAPIPGMTAVYSWPALIERVNHEQGQRDELQVDVYPCASIQCVQASAARA